MLLINDPSLGQDFREAPVHHLHFTEGADHHVRWLKVAMDHSPCMDVGHGLADGFEDGKKTGHFPRHVAPLAKQFGQGAALHELHGEEGTTVGESTQLVNRHDPRVLELTGNLRLLDEAARQLRYIPVGFEQDFHGEVTA